MKVAVLGLGTMGAPMAANLARAGMQVVVHNRSRERELPLLELGATRAASPADAAEGAAIVLSCVSDTPDAEQTLLDPERGVIASAAPGCVVIDCSTISPDGARRIGAALAKKGVGFLDAPVSGGPEGAKNGTLAVMCGGSLADFETARPVLEVVGGSLTLVGPVGCGQIAKAVNQVIIAGTYQSVAEGIALAHKAGADPRKVVSAIEHGAAASWILSNRAANIQGDQYPLGFRVRLHRKDLGIALQVGRDCGVPLPSAAYVASVEDGLIAQGHGDDDLSAIGRTVRRNAAIPDGPLHSGSTEADPPSSTDAENPREQSS